MWVLEGDDLSSPMFSASLVTTASPYDTTQPKTPVAGRIMAETSYTLAARHFSRPALEVSEQDQKRGADSYPPCLCSMQECSPGASPSWVTVHCSNMCHPCSSTMRSKGRHPGVFAVWMPGEIYAFTFNKTTN